MKLPNFDHARTAYTEVNTGVNGPIGPDWDELSFYEQSRFAGMYDAGRRDSLPELLAHLPQEKLSEILKPFDQGFIRTNSELFGRAMRAETAAADVRAALRAIGSRLALLAEAPADV